VSLFRVAYRVDGADDLRKRLAELPEREAKPAILAGLYSARGLLVKAARAKAPSKKGDRSPASLRYGSLRSNIAGEVKGQGGASRRAIAAGAARSRGLFLPRVRVHTGSAFWGRLIETGWKLTRKLKDGTKRVVRRIPAQQWFYKAIEAEREAVNRRIAEEVRKRLNRGSTPRKRRGTP
jgi:hypothetical protein